MTLENGNDSTASGAPAPLRPAQADASVKRYFFPLQMSALRVVVYWR